MKEPKILYEKFKQFLTRQSGIVNSLTFPYAATVKGMGQKKQIAFALVLWKHLRTLMEHGHVIDFQEKRDFIFFLLEKEKALFEENNYAKIVAQIEALPTKVWRRLLWHENIDFVSYETCLRRLSAEQIGAIKNNFNDLFPPTGKAKAPRVFKKTLRDRIKVFFGVISPNKLLAAPLDFSRRYQSKGAWAFNLLGIDFGFSLYPKGENDDTKITNKSFTRFLSIKEHINDFVVNQEDGKYWGLYKSARSNFAFWPDKEIKLKSHICPGFWMTFFIQGAFWILSPFMFAFAGSLIAAKGFHLVNLLPLIGALPMILWIIVAFFRLLVGLLSYCKGVMKVIGYTLLGLLLLAFALIVIAVIVFIFTSLFKVMAPLFGPFLSVLTILTAFFYAFFAVRCLASDNPLFKYKGIPAFVRFILHLSVGAPLLIAFDHFLTAPVVRFIVWVAQGFWQWYTYDLLISNWIILSVLFFSAFVRFCGLYLGNEKNFVKLRKTFIWLTRGFLTLTLLVFGIEILKIGDFDLTQIGFLAGLLFSLIILAFGFSFLMLDKVNPFNIDERQKALNYMRDLDDAELSSSFVYKTYIEHLLKSKWLSALETEKKWETIDEMRSVAYHIFDNRKKRLAFSELMASQGSLNTLETLIKTSSEIYDCSDSESEKLQIVASIINGLTLPQAIAKMYKDRSLAREMEEKARNFSRRLAAPFVYTGKGVAWLFTRIGHFFLSLKDVYELFNKLCPYVYKPRLLD